MEHAFTWIAFAGAWLLVAGPIYQAALELQEEDFERDRLRSLATLVPPPEPVSHWWWLVPPVYLMLRHRRTDRHQQELLVAMSDRDYDALMHYLNKATGWFMVGGGAGLLAVAETYQVTEDQDWPIALFAVLVVVLALGCAMHTVLRLRRSDQQAAQRAARRDATSS